LKKIVLIVTALLILTGGTFAAMKWLGVGPFNEHLDAENEAQKKLTEKVIFIEMEPLIVPVFKKSSAAATKKIQIKLATRGQMRAKFIKQRMPKINDAFVRDLHAFLPRLLRNEEPIERLIIQQRLKVIADRLFGQEYFEDIMVQSLTDTP
tara:strand:+ start:93 stop:545 length:453 start_codon:yes stop_codon:yes gene_type:complete